MEEYRYGERDRLLTPRLNAPIAFGTYGVIVYTFTPRFAHIPGNLYHPINNIQEKEFWLGYYQLRNSVEKTWFIPAPDQVETGVFRTPDFGDLDDIIDLRPSPWFDLFYGRS